MKREVIIVIAIALMVALGPSAMSPHVQDKAKTKIVVALQKLERALPVI
ncbi:hypothetical protein [Emcibacter sp. SYSU 3D8]